MNALTEPSPYKHVKAIQNDATLGVIDTPGFDPLLHSVEDNGNGLYVIRPNVEALFRMASGEAIDTKEEMAPSRVHGPMIRNDSYTPPKLSALRQFDGPELDSFMQSQALSGISAKEMWGKGREYVTMFEPHRQQLEQFLQDRHS